VQCTEASLHTANSSYFIHRITHKNYICTTLHKQIVLLPLDVLKIKAQTNPESIAGRGIVDIFTKEGMNLYRGAGWTAARNAPGSFALFGGAAVVKEYGEYTILIDLV
jgi:Mitochondrial carrier protein